MRTRATDHTKHTAPNTVVYLRAAEEQMLVMVYIHINTEPCPPYRIQVRDPCTSDDRRAIENESKI